MESRAKVVSLTLGKGAQLHLGGALKSEPYDLSGWIEVEFRGSELSVPVVNLTASRPRETTAAGSPRAIHFSVGAIPGTGTLDLASRVGALDVAMTAAYDEIPAGPAPDDVVHSRLAPPTITGRATFEFGADAGGTMTMGATGTLDAPHPFSREEVPFDSTSVPIAVTGRRCGEVTLCVDMGHHPDHPGQRLLTEEQLAAAVTELNRIWGCSAQCCIRFRVTRTTYGAPSTLELRPENTTAVSALQAKFRDVRRGRCFPVLIVSRIDTGAGMTGQFDELGTTLTSAPESQTHGSVVTTHSGDTAFSPVGVGNILAHELGHAMGVGNSPRTPNPGGVVGHSSNQDNLMRQSGDPTLPDATLRANVKLNENQCAAARNSRIVQQTDHECGNAPLEPV